MTSKGVVGRSYRKAGEVVAVFLGKTGTLRISLPGSPGGEEVRVKSGGIVVGVVAERCLAEYPEMFKRLGGGTSPVIEK